MLCRRCAKALVEEKVEQGEPSEIVCHACKAPLLEMEIKEFLQDEQLFSRFLSCGLQKALAGNNFVSCPKCSHGFERAPFVQKEYPLPITEVGEDNRPLTLEALWHR